MVNKGLNSKLLGRREQVVCHRQVRVQEKKGPKAGRGRRRLPGGQASQENTKRAHHENTHGMEKDRERSLCKENGACGRDVDSFVG